MTTTAMPSLDSPRFTLPRQPGRVGAPGAEVGNLVSVASDVDHEGYSTNPELGPMIAWRRITLTAIIAWVAFGFAFILAAFPFQGFGWGPAVPAALVAAFFGWLGWRGMGRTRRFGTCHYVGDAGVTRVFVNGKRRTTDSVAYRDELTTTTGFTSVFVNGVFAYKSETLTFWEPDGRPALRLIGTYKEAPGPIALSVRATIAAAGKRRLPAAQRTLASGGQIVFPIVQKQRPTLVRTNEALVLEGRTLAYYKSHAAQPLCVDRDSVELDLREGYVDLYMRGSNVVLGTFERETLGNWDLLEQLVAWRGPRHDATSAAPRLDHRYHNNY